MNKKFDLEGQTLSKEEWLQKFIEAKQQFDENEFPFPEDEISFTLEDTIGIAHTDEYFDTNEDFEYQIQCSLDLKNHLDVYEIENEYIHITHKKYMSYEDMLENLTASYDDWIGSDSGIDRDFASDLIFDFLTGQDMSKTIEKYAKVNVTIEFKQQKSSKG